MSEFSSEQGQLASIDVDHSATVHIYPTGTLSLNNAVFSVDSSRTNCHCPNEDHDYLAHSDVDTDMEFLHHEVKEEVGGWNEMRSNIPRFQLEPDTPMETADPVRPEVQHLDVVLREMGEGTANPTRYHLFRGVRMVIQSQIPVPEVSQMIGVCISTLYEYVDNAREGLRLLSIAEQGVSNQLNAPNSQDEPDLLGEWSARSHGEVRHSPPPMFVDSLMLPNGKIVNREDISIAIYQIASRLLNPEPVKTRVSDALSCILLEGRATEHASRLYKISVPSLSKCVSRVVDRLSNNQPAPVVIPVRSWRAEPVVRRLPSDKVMIPNGKWSTVQDIGYFIDRTISLHEWNPAYGRRMHDAVYRILVDGWTDTEMAKDYNVSVQVIRSCVSSALRMLEEPKKASTSGEQRGMRREDKEMEKRKKEGDKTETRGRPRKKVEEKKEGKKVEEKKEGGWMTLSKGKPRMIDDGKGGMREIEDKDMEVPPAYTFGEGSQSIKITSKGLWNVLGVIIPRTKSMLEKVIELDLLDPTKKRPIMGTKKYVADNIKEVLWLAGYMGKAASLIALTLTENRSHSIPQQYRWVVQMYRKLVTHVFDPITVMSDDGAKVEFEVKSAPYTFGEGEHAITVPGHEVVTVEGVVLPRSRDLLYSVIDLDLVDSSKRKSFTGTKADFILKLREILSIVGAPISRSVLVSLLASHFVDQTMDINQGRRKLPVNDLKKYQHLITLLFHPITIVPNDPGQAESVNGEVDEDMEKKEENNDREQEEEKEREEEEEEEHMEITPDERIHDGMEKEEDRETGNEKENDERKKDKEEEDNDDEEQMEM